MPWKKKMYMCCNISDVMRTNFIYLFLLICICIFFISKIIIVKDPAAFHILPVFNIVCFNNFMMYVKE